MSYSYGNTRDASDLIHRTDYRTRYIGYYGKQQNKVGAIIHVDGGSGASSQASEYTYLVMGRTMITDEELQSLFNPGKIKRTIPSTVISLYNDPFYAPSEVVIMPDGSIYMTNGSENLYKLTSTGATLVNTGIPIFPLPSLTGLAVWNGILYILDTANSKVYAGNTIPYVDLGIASLAYPTKMRVYGSSIYYLEDGASTIKMSSIAPGSTATVIAGSTPGFADGFSAQFNYPLGFVVDSTGENLYIADTGNSLIRQMSTTTYNVTTLAGNTTGFLNPFPTDNVGNRDGNGIYGDTLLYHPGDITISPDGVMYISDTGNNCIRKLMLDGTLTTIAGVPGVPPVYDFSPAAYLDDLSESSLWSAPNSIIYTNTALYIADQGNNAVRILKFAYTV